MSLSRSIHEYVVEGMTCEHCVLSVSEEVSELAGLLFAPEKLSISGIGPSERVFRAAARRINPAVLARAA